MSKLPDRRYQSLEGQQCNYLIPTPVMAMMSGVAYASQERNGIVTLHYLQDSAILPGEEETAWLGEDFQIADHEDDFFTVVRLVQSKRQQGDGNDD